MVKPAQKKDEVCDLCLGKVPAVGRFLSALDYDAIWQYLCAKHVKFNEDEFSILEYKYYEEPTMSY